jgi:hypothetical protein
MKDARPKTQFPGRRQSSNHPSRRLVFVVLLLCSAVALAKPNCNSNPSHPSCSGVDDDKQSVPLDCLIASENGDTLLDDVRGVYFHGQENVVCRTGEVGKVNLSGLVFSAFQGKTKGKNTPASREMDLALSLSPDLDLDTTHLPDSIFQAGVFEHLRIAVRPYQVAPYYQTDIQRLTPGLVYPMALQINEQLGNDWKINLAGAVVAGDSLQGVLCNDNEDAVTTDVNVYVWPDENPADGNPDGYTVTTRAYDYLTGEWALTEGPMIASVCSNSGDLDCAHQSDRWCNYLGEVYVQFTIDMLVQ